VINGLMYVAMAVRRRRRPSWTLFGDASSAWSRRRWKRWRPSTKYSWRTFCQLTLLTTSWVHHTDRRSNDVLVSLVVVVVVVVVVVNYHHQQYHYLMTHKKLKPQQIKLWL